MEKNKGEGHFFATFMVNNIPNLHIQLLSLGLGSWPFVTCPGVVDT